MPARFDTLKTQHRPYPAIFDPSSGRFIRGDDPETGGDVFWNPRGPEMLDISITGRCTGPGEGGNCGFCYRKATPFKDDLPIESLRAVLDQLRGLFVCQIALGGGNPPLHPQFPEILRLIREDYGIVPNYTYNGSNLSDEGLEATRAYCGAVAVSWYRPELCFSECRRLISRGIKTNIHFVLSQGSLGEATAILEGSREIPEGINAIIFLTHKPVGWGRPEDCIDPKSRELEIFKESIAGAIRDRRLRVGFDSCFVSALVRDRRLDANAFDSCEAGRFSGFIDEHLRFSPCSFADDHFEGVDLHSVSFHDAWVSGTEFQRFRAWLQARRCDCDDFDRCRGGCPITGAHYCGLPQAHSERGCGPAGEERSRR